jgi:hypothetical protein
MTCRPLTRRLWIQKLLRFDVKLFVFYGFGLKPRVTFIRSRTCTKNLERDRALFYLFSGLVMVTRKRNPLGVDFKPFSRLPKHEKIVERPCYFHAR